MISSTDFVKGSFWMLCATMLVYVLNFITSIILARLLGAELFGIFSINLVVVSVLAIFCDSGLLSSATYFISFYEAKKMRQKVVALFSTFFKLRLMLTLVASAALFFCSDFFAALFHAPQGGIYFRISSAYLVFFSLFSFFEVAFISLKKFKQLAISNSLISTAKLVFSSAFVVLGFGLDGALVGFVLASMIVCFFMMFLVKKLICFKATANLKEVKSYWFFSGITVLVSAAVGWVDSVLIGVLMMPAHVGFYRIAMTFAMSVASVLAVFTRVLFPFLVVSETKKEEMRSFFKKIMKYNFFICLPAMFGLVIVAKPLVLFFFGHQYADAAPVLAILSFLCFDAIITGSFCILFNALKKPEILTKINVVELCMIVVLMPFFIQYYGIFGAAVITILSRICAFCMILFFAKKEGFLFTAKDFSAPLLSSLLMFVLLYDAACLIKDLLSGLVIVCLGAFIYLACCWLLGFDVVQFLKKILSIGRRNNGKGDLLLQCK